MKKLLFSTVAMLLVCASAAFAQPKIIFDGSRSVNFKLKRCYVEGPNCIIDVLITNMSNEDLNPCVGVGDGLFRTDLSAFDDEGNTYDKYGITGTIGNTNFGGGTYNSGGASLPAGTSIKLRFKIKNIDEFATQITTLICNFRGVSDEAYGKATLKITNIPITRE